MAGRGPAVVVTLALSLPVWGCERRGEIVTPEQTDPAEVPSTGVAGLLASMDASAEPCVDFYRYACGGWLDANPRPADKAFYGRIHPLVERNEAVLRELLEAAGAEAEAGSADPRTRKLGDYYNACMDTAARDAAGVTPLRELVATIDGARDKRELMRALGRLHATLWGRVDVLGRLPAPPFFAVSVFADYVNAPDRNMAILEQAGLGLPARAMYLPPAGPEGEAGRALLRAYEQHIATMLTLLGASEADATAQAKIVLEIETALAEASLTPVELRDDQANYHKDGFEGLREQAKGVDWAAYFEAAGLPQTTELNLRTPKFLVATAKLIERRELAELQAYLRWMVIHAAADELSTSVRAANFELARLVTGVAEPPPIQQRCVDSAMWALPDLVGPAFVELAFAGASKSIAHDMVARINAALATSLVELPWLDEPTRAGAEQKIAALDLEIGYPDRWHDYAELEIGSSHFANLLAERSAAHARELEKIGAPVDEGEWLMPAPLVNAYYHPTNNELAFPAGILQPPLFDAEQPMVMNFAGIGVVAGHELTHGFDDQGRKYDASGRLHDWWSPAVAAAFEQRVACVVEQYGAYEPLPGKRIDGALTAGENIADIGGVKEAYFAYQSWAAERGGDPAVVEGMSNEQVFFVAYAQTWCQHVAGPALERQLEGDPHSPGEFRAIGPLVNLPEFATAFSCAEGTPMNPANRCEIW